MVVEHLNQPTEEQRGANLEFSRGFYVPAQAAAGAAQTDYPLYVDGRASADDYGALIRRIQIVTSALVTGVDTNNFTLTIRRYPIAAGVRGAATTIAALLADHTIVLAASVPFDLANANTTPFVSPFAINPGDVITYSLVQNGTGLAVPVSQLTFELARVDKV